MPPVFRIPRNLRKLTRRWPLLIPAAVLIISLVMNFVWPLLVYGSNTISGSDELRFIDRGRAIAQGRISVTESWYRQGYIDAYPPGYAIIVANIFVLFPGIDAFDISIIMRMLTITIITLLYFWFGLFFSKNVAILTAVARSTLFIIYISSPSNYVYLYSTLPVALGGNLTEIAILLTLIFIFRYASKTGSDTINLSMIFLIGIFHGWIHISGFMSFTFFMILFLVLIQFFSMRSNFSSPRGHFKETFYGLLSGRYMIPVCIFLLQPLTIFLSYYFEVLVNASPDIYEIEMLFPIPIPIEWFLTIIVSVFILGIVGLIKFLSKGHAWVIPIPTYSNKPLRNISFAYIVTFLLIMIAVNLDQSRYAFANFAILTGFPSYIPINADSFISVLSFSVGLFLFAFSTICLFDWKNQKLASSRFIILFHISSYFFFACVFFLGVLTPHRSLFFTVSLPFLIALSLIWLWSPPLKRLPSFLRTRTFTIRKISRFTAVMIVAGFFLISIILRANMDPSIRENIQGNDVLGFGSTTPPIVTSDFIEEVKRHHIDGSNILSTPDTQSALFAFLDFTPLSPYFDPETWRNDDWSTVKLSLTYGYNQSPSKWLKNHNGTLVVVGFADVHEGNRQYGFVSLDLTKFDSDPNLKKVYQDQYNQSIYQLIS